MYMFNFFDLKIIPIFLSRFKVEKVVVIGLSNVNIIEEVISFCIENDSLLYAIDSEIDIEDFFVINNKNKHSYENIKYFKDNAFNVLPNLRNIDAIFINDDPNWYTVYSELNLIKKTNSNFPLVFICNNKYPHKRRDSYSNLDNIPNEYKNECCNKLIIEYVDDNEMKYTEIEDGFCHAIHNNTPKNGVLTAIEDFLNENLSLKILDINSLEGLSLIYKDSGVAYFRVNKILDEGESFNYSLGDLSDKVVENHLLLKYIDEANLYKDEINQLEDFKSELNLKNNQIKKYENEIKLYNNEINYKNSQISTVKSQMSLKETELQNVEAKLLNATNEAESKEIELNNFQNELNDLKTNFSYNKKELENTKKQLFEVTNKFKTQEIIENKYKELIELNKKEIETSINEIEFNKNQINDADNQLKRKEVELQSKTSELQNKSRELQNKAHEINLLKSELNETTIQLNSKVNQLITSEVEIENKNSKINELKSRFIKQSSKLNTNEYCISCYEEKILNNKIEIEYLKKNNKLIKKIFVPLAYLCIIAKSKWGEIKTNFQLYRALKKSNCFDIGYYLNNYPDVFKSKWCKYFSPELHYVCVGFYENRKFNKKFYNNTNKRELLKHIKDK